MSRRTDLRAAHRYVRAAACLRYAAGAAAQPKTDLLTFAHGAMPLRVQADAAARVTVTPAVRAIDGALGVHVVTAPVPSGTRVAFVYELPAPTVFDHFVVPNVVETPSPTQTFDRDVAVFGLAQSPTEGFELIASGVLSAHRGKLSTTLQRQGAMVWGCYDRSGRLEGAVSGSVLNRRVEVHCRS